MLKFDYEKIVGKNITSVHGENVRAMNDGSFNCDRIIIGIADAAVEIAVNIDTDELIIELYDPYESCAALTDIGNQLNLMGRKLGWAWTAKNYRGYYDAFMLALGEIVPEAQDPAYAFVGAGSSISVFAMTQIRSPEISQFPPQD